MSHSSGLFLPYQPEADSFIIEKGSLLSPDIGADGLPVPPVPLLLGHDDHAQFLEWGEQHVGNMRRILADAGFAFRPGQRVLDFGCGSGRMIRHFKREAETSRFFGVDIRSEHIMWCRHHLSPPFTFATTTVVPHLPFEDSSFDLVYSGSVFTHIDDLADAWFLELQRVLRPGGLLYFTVHDAHSAELTKTTLRDHFVGKILFSHKDYERYVNSDFAMFTVWRSAESQVFYDLGYLRARLRGLWNEVAVHQEAYGFQTAVLVEKPDAGQPVAAARRSAELERRLAKLQAEHDRVLSSRSYRIGVAIATPYWRLLDLTRRFRGRRAAI